MGVRFHLEQASLVGWLTRRDFPSPTEELDWGPGPGPWDWHFRNRYRRMTDYEGVDMQAWRAPRVPLRVLREFLDDLPESVVTSHGEDHDLLRRFVGKCQDTLASWLPKADAGPIVQSLDVARILAPLRRWFDLPFYFMPLGQYVQFEAFRDSTNYTIWLQCQDDRAHGASRDLLDPFPPLKQLFSSRTFEPATVCWTWSGGVAVIPQRTAPVEELLDMVRRVPPWRLWAKLKGLHRPESPPFNILQLSDLHFGASAVTDSKLAYVEQELRERIDQVRDAGGVVQPVITGDLMDTPKQKSLEQFGAFRNRLADYAKTEVICIPGNHDMKKSGFLWKNWKVLAGLEWSSVVASSACKVVFSCFDTSRDAKLARGRIASDQFLEVATKLGELRRRGGYEDYINISLVHHHPFSARDDEIDTVPFLGLKEEPFLRMENGDQLVRWCASHNVPLILHGHKHKPRFVGQELELNGRTRMVRAVGCGSTLGIEGKPLSFNWITWQPSTRQWTVTFHAALEDGSGFQEKRLVIGSAEN